MARPPTQTRLAAIEAAIEALFEQHQAQPPVRMYHGTSVSAALQIQRDGFRVDLSGSNAGARLGNGVYCSSTLQKALNYASARPHKGSSSKPLRRHPLISYQDYCRLSAYFVPG